MKSMIWIQAVLVAMASILLTSCDDKNDGGYEPGEPAPANCMTVYFRAENTPDAVFEEGRPVVKTITLARKLISEAAEVPIVCKNVAPEISVPSSVHFDAGQATAEIDITAGNMQTSRVYSYEISVDKQYVDPYADVYGSADFSGTLVVASWDVFAENVKMTWTTQNAENQWRTTIERLGNLDHYRVKNFAGSGLDIEIVPGGDSSYGKTYKTFTIPNNVEEYDDGEVKGYLLFDDNAQDYPRWETVNREVSELCIMTYYGSTDYSYISFKERYIMFGVYYTDYTDGTYDYYNYIRLQWQEGDEK